MRCQCPSSALPWGSPGAASTTSRLLCRQAILRSCGGWTTVMDWFARRVLASRLSISLEVDFCIEVVDEALRLYGTPQIFNTDQGSQFTSDRFTEVLIDNDITISMDGKGAWRDNVFLERFWRTLKYEEVYLKAYESVAEARSSISRFIEFYNGTRPHSSLDRRTPDQAYYASLPNRVAVKRARSAGSAS